MLGEIPTPVETFYAGHRFRSRLEARWGVFFDCLGIVWEYEPEGYALGEETWYLPDFLLPRLGDGLWCEVKHVGGDFDLAWRFAVQQKVTMWLCEGLPGLRGQRFVGPLSQAFCDDWHALFPVGEYAADQARMARFEHGEGRIRYRACPPTRR